MLISAATFLLREHKSSVEGVPSCPTLAHVPRRQASPGDELQSTGGYPLPPGRSAESPRSGDIQRMLMRSHVGAAGSCT